MEILYVIYKWNIWLRDESADERERLQPVSHEKWVTNHVYLWRPSFSRLSMLTKNTNVNSNLWYISKRNYHDTCTDILSALMKKQYITVSSPCHHCVITVSTLCHTLHPLQYLIATMKTGQTGTCTFIFYVDFSD